MAHELRQMLANSTQRPGSASFGAHELVQMKPPANSIQGVVVDDEPLVVGGVRYWRVAWSFGGERRVTWSPESAILAR
ncbi:MAG: hypothetical protein ACLPSH_10325 [Vulcanimicrobiaceae bacterium]